MGFLDLDFGAEKIRAERIFFFFPKLALFAAKDKVIQVSNIGHPTGSENRVGTHAKQGRTVILHLAFSC
jgi:hypothetical protein